MRTPQECAEFMIYTYRGKRKALEKLGQRLVIYNDMLRPSHRHRPFGLTDEEVKERLTYWSAVADAIRKSGSMHE